MKHKKKITKDEELKNSVKKFNLKLALIVLLTFSLIFSVYQVCIIFELGFIIHVYAAVLALLAIAFGILNRGFSKDPPSEEMLPDDWDKQTKQKYIEDDTKRKKKAKILLIPIIGLLLTFFYECIYVFYLEQLF